MIAAAGSGIIPGYDNRNLWRLPPRLITDRWGGETYRTLWQEAIAAAPDYVLITSWNEWHEGSELEASVEYGSRSLTRRRRSRKNSFPTEVTICNVSLPADRQDARGDQFLSGCCGADVRGGARKGDAAVRGSFGIMNTYGGERFRLGRRIGCARPSSNGQSAIPCNSGL
jgi:hypothetical protein